MSIGKNTLGPSVSASMKAKYALDSQGFLTIDTLNNAFVQEIKDELKISGDKIHFDVSRNVTSIYRDLIEGGKPQINGLLCIDQSFQEVRDNFMQNLKKSDSEKKVVDGKDLVAGTMQEVRESLLHMDKRQALVLNGKKYAVSPSHATSLVLMDEFFATEENNGNN